MSHETPRQNRVTPFGDIISDPMRGLFMGNRGCLHNDRGQVVRQHALKRWIICVTDFKSRKRQLMRPGHYTELFFLDEVTALAAGHRPCAECQRARYTTFLDASGYTRAGPLDDCLEIGRRITPAVTDAQALPDGSMVADGTRALLRWQNAWLLWSNSGYVPADPPPANVRLLTPDVTVKALANGYRPVVYGVSGWPSGPQER